MQDLEGANKNISSTEAPFEKKSLSKSKLLDQKAYELLGHEKYLDLKNNISTSVELFFPFLKGVNWLLFRSVSFAGREQCEKFNSFPRDCVIS